MNLQLRMFRSQLGELARVDTKLEIPIVFHIIHDGNTGKVSSSMIQEQMSILNDAYAGTNHAENNLDTNIRFKLFKTTYTDNPTWFEDCKSSSYDFRPEMNMDSKQ